MAFPTYESRDFALFTESYGGHYGPEFSEYFIEQNAAIDAGTATGEKINLVVRNLQNKSKQYNGAKTIILGSRHQQRLDRSLATIPGMSAGPLQTRINVVKVAVLIQSVRLTQSCMHPLL